MPNKQGLKTAITAPPLKMGERVDDKPEHEGAKKCLDEGEGSRLLI